MTTFIPESLGSRETKGNAVCADLCWKTEAELTQEARPRPSYTPSSYSRRWRRTA